MADNWNGGVKFNYPALNIRLFTPLPSEYLGPEETAEEAFERVCNGAGATLPKRDAVDERIVQEVINNTGKVPLTMADVPSEAFPTLNSLPAPADDDRDGMPNDWESAHGLNPNDPSDRNTIGQDGYTMLEVYLNGLTGELVIGVEDVGSTHPGDPVLQQNYPNPFNPCTTITYQLPVVGYASLIVYDVYGREVATLVEGIESAGLHTVTFDGGNLSSGVYFARLRVASVSKTIKIAMMR